MKKVNHQKFENYRMNFVYSSKRKNSGKCYTEVVYMEEEDVSFMRHSEGHVTENGPIP